MGRDFSHLPITGKREGDFGAGGQTCDGAVVVISRDPRQPHASLGQIRQLQVPGAVRSFCWNGINEAGIVPGASPSSHHLSQSHGQDVLQGTIHVLQLFKGPGWFLKYKCGHFWRCVGWKSCSFPGKILFFQEKSCLSQKKILLSPGKTLPFQKKFCVSQEKIL